MGVIQNTLALSTAGNNGGITAIPTNIAKYNEYLYGVRQASYVNLLAETAVGKTGLGRHLYVHTPYEEYLRINDPSKLDVLFIDISLEIAAEANMAAAISRKIYMDYQRVIPPSSIFGWGDNKLTDEQKRLIHHPDIEAYFDRFQKKCVVVDGEVGPKLFHDILFEAAKRVGRFDREGANINTSGTYTLHNPNLYVICLLDTVNLSETDEIFNTVKLAMDRMSRYAVLFRNKCRFFFCFLQQISAEIASTDRSRYGITSPILRDAEDSRRPGKDANIVLGLYEPIRHMKEDQSVFKGYDMNRLQSWLRTLHILKHREGVMNKYIPLKAYGAVSYFEQLPYAKNMTEQDYELAVKY